MWGQMWVNFDSGCRNRFLVGLKFICAKRAVVSASECWMYYQLFASSSKQPCSQNIQDSWENEKENLLKDIKGTDLNWVFLLEIRGAQKLVLLPRLLLGPLFCVPVCSMVIYVSFLSCPSYYSLFMIHVWVSHGPGTPLSARPTP